MTCELCGCDDLREIECYLTCLGCGNMSEHVPKYVQGYATPRKYMRKQYYSRIKRFAKTLQDMKNELVGTNTAAILRIYGNLEFGWSMQPTRTRRYFFSQKVVLFFILKTLQLDLDVSVLKNKERTETQLAEMEAIMNNPMFSNFVGFGKGL